MFHFVAAWEGGIVDNLFIFLVSVPRATFTSNAGIITIQLCFRRGTAEIAFQ